MTKAEKFWSDKLDTAISIGEMQKFSCEEHKKEFLSVVKNLKVIGLEAIRIAKEEEAFNFLQKGVDGIEKSLKDKPSKIAIEFIGELESRVRLKTIQEIESWVNKELNALEIQKDSTLGISHYAEGKLDKLYEVQELTSSLKRDTKTIDKKEVKK